MSVMESDKNGVREKEARVEDKHPASGLSKYVDVRIKIPDGQDSVNPHSNIMK